MVTCKVFIYLFFLIKKETKKSRLTDNFGNNLPAGRQVYGSVAIF
jgi:hypothetical protein